MAETRRAAAVSSKIKKNKGVGPPAVMTVKKTTQEKLLAREEEYKRLNAELEAKTAELVREAEEVMREQQQILSRPALSQVKLFDEDEDENLRKLLSPEVPALTLSHVKTDGKTGTKSSARNRPHTATNAKKQAPRPRPKTADVRTASDVAIPSDIVDFSLAKTINKIESKLEAGEVPENAEDDVIPGINNDIGAVPQRFKKFTIHGNISNLFGCGQWRKIDERL
ncbi:unnamed protein product [Ranitomeya imitator]|uniref:Uncharacterized protein n=1 Tax=Ranitomeya imitator TaxID=111125 RepID=A0ABN9MA79_9NEOB|nr:unnamed protein product [Ranitomeya imitator]